MKQQGFKFTPRDTEVILSIYKHRFLTVTQIMKLHFPSMQTAYRRLRILREAGYLAGFSIANIEELIFSVAKKGLEIVAQALGVNISDLRWTEIKSKPRDYYFMRHFLAINDFRIVLAQACDKYGIQLLGFIPEYLGERSKKGGISKYIRDVVCDIEARDQEISHTPDGVFALQRAGKAALFFVEIDRGTETVSDTTKGVLKSLRFYANYLISADYQRYVSDFKVESFKGFRLLCVTTSESRIANIREAAQSLPGQEKAKRFLWITTFDDIEKKGLFGQIWKSMDISDARSYQIG